MSEQNTTTTVQLSELEMQLLIENLIEDVGTVPKALTWVNRKIAEVEHELLSRGANIERHQLQTWERVYLYFQKNYQAIARMSKVSK